MKRINRLRIFGFLIIIGIYFGYAGLQINSMKTENTISSIPSSKVISSDTTLKIVVANSIISDIVESVSGTEPVTIVSGAEDPHSYEPSSSEISSLEDADIIFRLGLDHIEPWWDSTWEDAVVVELVKDSMLLEDPLLGEHDHDEESAISSSLMLQAEEELENPHVWMDPNNIKSFTSDVESTLSAQDAENVATYAANAATYQAMLTSLLAEIEQEKASISGTKVVVNHPAFLYLFKLLDIERVATIEKGEGKEPSAEDIATIINEMLEEDVHLIIANPQHESDNVYEIARSTESKIALLSPLLNVEVTWNGEQKTLTNYQEMIRYDLWALKNPVDPPSIFDYWWVFFVISVVIVGLAVFFIIIRRRD